MQKFCVVYTGICGSSDKWDRAFGSRLPNVPEASGVIRSYGLNIYRQCFRERADKLGFKKYDSTPFSDGFFTQNAFQPCVIEVSSFVR
jgi:hypothetical protein